MVNCIYANGLIPGGATQFGYRPSPSMTTIFHSHCVKKEVDRQEQKVSDAARFSEPSGSYPFMFTIPEYHSKRFRAVEMSAADVNYRR